MKFIKLIVFIFWFSTAVAQQPENIYSSSLEKVLADVEKKFQVKIAYHPLLKDKTVTYAVWRMRTTLNETLDNIVRPLDLNYEKIDANTYSVKPFRYHMRSEQEGKLHLQSLLSNYSGAKNFNQRKADLKKNISATMGIDLDRKRHLPNVVRSSKRIMHGYSVENIAIETFPGYYLAGSLYKPLKSKGRVPAVLCPHGHFPDYRNDSLYKQGRYRPDMQIRCAALAKMGAIVFNYDMYAWGESMLQTLDTNAHANGIAMALQTWNSIRAVDFLSSLQEVDVNRMAVTGASGGGTQTILLAALDSRINLSVPVVMVSSSFYGGCGCESGLPIHSCVKDYTNNAEIAAMAAPNPQLVISDGSDWTVSVPTTDYPYLKKVYAFYGKEQNIESVYLPNDQHDYGLTKRIPMYNFLAKHFKLNVNNITSKSGQIDESGITIEGPFQQQVFSEQVPLPANALKGHKSIVNAFKDYHHLTDDFKYY